MVRIHVGEEALSEGDGSHFCDESRRAGESGVETQQADPVENALLVGFEEFLRKAVEYRCFERLASQECAEDGVVVVIEVDSDVLQHFH
jgi:hypothetical protein